MREAGTIRKFWWILQKDWTMEMRTKDRWVAMMAFVLMTVFLFAFAMGSTSARISAAFPGILWMAFLFAGMIGMKTIFGHEMPEETLTGLILAPGDRAAVYLAKMAGSFIFMALVEAASTPIFFALLQEPWPKRWGLLALVLTLGALGFVEVGTLFSMIGAQMPSGDLILTTLLIPLEIPVMITAVQATADMLVRGRGSPWLWIHGLMGYDAIFMALSLMLYDYLWEV